MFKKALWDWAYQCTMGIGCSLIAAAMLGAIISTTPAYISFAVVTGLVMLILALVIKFAQAIPSSQ
jgi:hypothetical protein